MRPAYRHAETVFPNAELLALGPEDRNVLVTLMRWAREREFITLGPPVFLLTQSITEMHPVLRDAASRIEAVRVPLPDMKERGDFIVVCCQTQDVPVDDVSRAAALTAGLKRLHIEDIVLRAKLAGRPVDADLIKARKDEIVRAEFAEVLELIEPEHGFEVIGGMDYVKQFFQKNVINPIKNGNLRRVPIGVLLPGPPGTGKTVIAEAVAKESGLNCARLDLSRIFSQWVGAQCHQSNM